MQLFFPIAIILVIIVFICLQNQADNRLCFDLAGGGKRRKRRRSGSEHSEHKFTVKDPYFEQIKNGKKTVEGRLKKGRFEHIKKGDTIYWVNRDTKEEVKTKVTDHKTYDHVSDMIKNVGHKKLLPGTKSNDEAQEKYNTFYGEDKQKENKAIAIHFEKE